MQVIDAASEQVMTVTSETTIHEVARLMAADGLRVVVVEDSGWVVGIVTERDLVVRALAHCLSDSTPVETVMTPDPVTVDGRMPMSEAYLALHDRRVRQAPVLDGGRLVGMLSMADHAIDLAATALRPEPAPDISTTTVPSPRLRCPRCGGHHLRIVAGTERGNVLCLSCRRCWRAEDGHLVQVNPHACAGCPDRRYCLFLVDDYAEVREPDNAR